MIGSQVSHLRFRRRVGLLAAGALEGRDQERTRAHVEACPRCRREYAELAAVVAAIEADPVRSAVPELPVSALLDRVDRQIDRAADRPPVAWRRLALPAAAVAALAVVLLGPELASRLGPEPPAPAPTRATVAPDPAAALSAEMLDRLDRNMARGSTARYLSEAQDVLLAVAATEADCVREEDRVDVGEAPDRSRELLARRALLVEGRPEAVASARAVLDDVEMALREVADLPSCVRRRDVERLRREVDQRHLHMRIRLMTRELEG
ncbi:MAG: zf-HC2 domain-containing protein [Acidobacteria bacterium]|nr:zf-HC2 domain-containing protein [Acidobacteriota bacterium]